MTQQERSKYKQKRLGECLCEARLITPEQLDIALNEQNLSGQRLGEILTIRGWVEQQTIRYFMEKVVLSEQLAVEKELFDPTNDNRQNINLVETTDFDSTSLTIPLHQLIVKISAKKVLQFLLLVILGINFVSLVGQLCVYFLPNFPLKTFFAAITYIDNEVSIPALYSTSTLLLCSILLWIISHTNRGTGQTYISHWRALSIIFLYLSCDEYMALHERLIEPLRKAFNVSGFFYFAWVIPGGIFVLICLLAFLGFIIALPKKTQRLFLIAGTVFVSGAIGTELVGGYYVELHGAGDMIYVMIATIEEFLEMVGIAIFTYALLSYITGSADTNIAFVKLPKTSYRNPD
ncbi:MAG: hypothetical protein HC862_26255 [Scytonema sp. RU_4_4]|nr:hypothetical protein [Scytonema sp. RU_4_4]